MQVHVPYLKKPRHMLVMDYPILSEYYRALIVLELSGTPSQSLTCIGSNTSPHSLRSSEFTEVHLWAIGTHLYNIDRKTTYYMDRVRVKYSREFLQDFERKKIPMV
jgi:hypothetical protein